MFERFTEDARRALFCGRAKSAERHGHEITTEDFLAGILLAAPNAVSRFVSAPTDHLIPPETGEEFMQRLHSDGTFHRVAGKRIPFASAARVAVERAIQEADDLRHQDVRPEHLLLGLLRDESSEAWRTLHDGGVALREVRVALVEERDKEGRE